MRGHATRSNALAVLDERRQVLHIDGEGQQLGRVVGPGQVLHVPRKHFVDDVGKLHRLPYFGRHPAGSQATQSGREKRQ